MKEFLFNVSVFSPQLNRLVSLQSFCDSNQVKANKNIRAFLLSESEWDGVHQLVYTLKPFDKYTKALQSERVTLSDFFGYWTMLRIKVAKVNDNLSANLLLRMNDYHEMLMENPSILGAVFLDPRYQRGLTNKQPAAIQFLVNLYLRMQVVESDTVEQEIVEVDVVDDMSEDDSLEDMNVFLNACGSVHQNNNNNIVNNNVSNNKEQFISELLTKFIGIVPQDLKKSIWEIWETKQQSDPELYHLATAVFSIPPTQTTVERAFSSLPIILNSHRTRIGDTTFQNILLVRLNRDLIDGVVEEENQTDFEF